MIKRIYPGRLTREQWRHCRPQNAMTWRHARNATCWDLSGTARTKSAAACGRARAIRMSVCKSFGKRRGKGPRRCARSSPDLQPCRVCKRGGAAGERCVAGGGKCSPLAQALRPRPSLPSPARGGRRCMHVPANGRFCACFNFLTGYATAAQNDSHSAHRDNP
jgi:hypothetical protein